MTADRVLVSDGVLVIDKPAGMTSHDVVSRIRRTLGGRRKGPKVGHAGTLDPMATGVLVVGVGKATRLVPWLQASTKTYDARLQLGVTTTTLDAEGEVVTAKDASHIDERAICDALKGFVGQIQQTPPMVSAVRVGGERLHVRARRGEEVERPVRTVTIHDLVLEDFVPGPRGEAGFLVTCSSGTYVRSIADDVGAKLGVGAHLVALRRLASGQFGADQALSLDAVLDAIEDGRLDDVLLSMADALADYAAVKVTPEDALALGHGRMIARTGFDGPVAAIDGDGDLVAVIEDSGNGAKPSAVFKTSASRARTSEGAAGPSRAGRNVASS